MTQRRKIGVSRQAVAKGESAESLPDVEKCMAVAELFGVTVDDFLRHDESSLAALISPKGKHIFGVIP